jgi:predicted nucleotide-binding protein (sugar kinase/HSP70/actin superfamily)
MIIQITEQYLAQVKKELEFLRKAQEMAKDKEVIPVTAYRYDMQNLIGGGIVCLQQIVEKAEPH